jgi:glucose-1-phosphate adenylyltransferase
MGIYVFSRDVLFELLNNNHTDFGKHIIPNDIGNRRVFSHIFQGYWEDIGTVRAFFEANLDLTTESPKFNFFSPTVFSRPRYLPASKINSAAIDHAVISDGCIINEAQLKHTLVGIRSILESGCSLKRVVMMGADYFDTTDKQNQPQNLGIPLGVGCGSRIENAIIDKNARIGRGCILSPQGKPSEVDHPLYYIRDGILVIPKGGVIPDATVI